MSLLRSAGSFALVLGLLHCGPAMVVAQDDAGGGADARSGDAAGQPTYYQNVKPILAQRCVGCHQPGNIAPFSLRTYDEVAPRAALIAEATAARTMPPFPADPTGCEPLSDEHNMPRAEVDLIAAWVAAGAPAGDAAHPAPDPAPPADALGPPTFTWDMDVDYTPTRTDRPDDYRCFIIDPHLAQPTPVVAVSVRPGNLQMDHHASVFVVPPAAVAAARALDAADAAPGYECFGGARITGAVGLGGWVPGMTPQAFPDGTGGTIPAGSVFVVQMHYNMTNGRGSDRSTIELWSPAQAPTRAPTGFAATNTAFHIPAGARDYVATATTLLPGETAPDGMPATAAPAGLLWRLFVHQHLLGTTSRVELLHADGTTQCLLDIPRWDFHWQLYYNLARPVRLGPGDRVRITCHWDNSAANQPTVNGVQQAPRDVTFGEGTQDEMCIVDGLMTSN